MCDRGSNTRGGLQVRLDHRPPAPPHSCLLRLHRPWLRPSACPLPGLPHLLRRLSRVSPPHGPRRGRQAGFLERFGVPLFRAAARLMPRLAPLADQVRWEAGAQHSMAVQGGGQGWNEFKAFFWGDASAARARAASFASGGAVVARAGETPLSRMRLPERLDSSPLRGRRGPPPPRSPPPTS